jgi:ATP-binding cassette, subfamily C, bacterial CydC
MSENVFDKIRLGLPRDRYFKVGLIVSILQGLSAVALLGVSAWLISRAAEVNSIVYLGLAIVGVRGFAVGRAAFRYGERLLLHESAFRMLAERRPQIFERIEPFIPAGMANLSRGETMARIVNDVDELQNLPLRVIAPLAQAVFVSSASILFIFTLLPSAGLALFATLLAGFFIAMPISAKFSKVSDSSIAPLKAHLASLSLDLLENQDVYLAYGWMDSKRQQLAEADAALRKAVAKTAVSNGAGLALFTLLATAAMVSGAYFGGTAVVDHALPGASLAIFMLMPMAIFEVLQNAQPAISAFRRFRVSASRIESLLDRSIPKELDLASGGLDLDVFRSLELQGVGVTYPDSADEVVSNIDLSLVPGQVLLLSGQSGSGKSSVALVLTRLINFSSGNYLINEMPVDSYSVESVRRRIGLVEQNPMIFVGDVRANLLLAKPSASDAELRHVLDEVGLWPTFANRQELSTELGDRGVLISGGEAQRLALARAILADFKVLILDEPTANVDQATADSLVDDLLRIARQNKARALVLISHEERYRKLVDWEIRI